MKTYSRITLLWIFVMLVLFIFSGCGTISYYSRGHGGEPVNFPGVKSDIADFKKTNDIEAQAIYIGDMPFSLIADAMLLPVTFPRWWEHRK